MAIPKVSYGRMTRHRVDDRSMAQPVLVTDRMLLVPLADRHLVLEHDLGADAEVLRFICGRAQTRPEIERQHGEWMELGRRVDGLGYWMAFAARRGSSRPSTEDVGEFVGVLMLPPVLVPDLPGPPVASLGYRLVRRYWRQGLATEAAQELLRHAFDTVRVSRVIAQTMAVNVGSRGVMRAVGMRHVGTFYPHWNDPLPGAELGEVEYEITRDEFERRRAAG